MSTAASIGVRWWWDLRLVSPPVVALVAVPAAWGGGWAATGWVLLGVVVAFGAPCVVTDARSRRLPDALTAPMALCCLTGLVTAGAVTGSWEPVLGGVLGAAVAGGALFAAAWFSSLGLGDVKLTVSLALATGHLGVLVPLVCVVAAVVLAAPHAVIVALRRGRHAHIPLGPYLLVGTVLIGALSLALSHPHR